MAITKEEMDAWLKSGDSRDYFELLKFPTIGAEPAHLKDCIRCATWLKKWLEGIGAEAKLIASTRRDANGVLQPDPPIVFAELKRDGEAPTVLFYGHYDVQPPDPLGEWSSPPFEPTVCGSRVRCRGAQDDKGQFFAALCGLRELALGEGRERLPNVKILLEGQEESGSCALAAMAPELGKDLAADVLLICDTPCAPDLRPAVVAGLRGVNHFTVTLTAANRDLHSGEYGGLAPNAAQGMAELVASLHNPDGSIAVAGFRDGVEPPSHEELAAAEAGEADARGYENDIGVEPCGGQMGKSIVQRKSFEPTIEVNGIHSGYGGPGSKTVIPCSAVAKISTRLVPGQDPAKAFAAVRTHLEDRVPRGMKMEISELTGCAAAFRLPIASPLVRLAEGILGELDPRGAVLLWDGASIPVVSALREASGAVPLLVGWGQGEDRIHSPDESYSLSQFRLAKEWARRIFPALNW